MNFKLLISNIGISNIGSAVSDLKHSHKISENVAEFCLNVFRHKDFVFFFDFFKKKKFGND
jgi:hypothetical protein